MEPGKSIVTQPAAGVELLLLRHGQVPNHRSDVPLTDRGQAPAEAAGRWFAEEGIEIAGLLSGETKRTMDTAAGFAAGNRDAGGSLPDPVVSFALRNPDFYLGGHRINMAEGAAALAAQSPSVDEDDVGQVPFYRDLMVAPDRVGFWLEHGNPPGDTARDVGYRIDSFARSLNDVPAWAGRTVVAITHSPVLRAVRYHHWGEYSKEPPFLHGYRLICDEHGGLGLTPFATGTGDLPVTAKPDAGLAEPNTDPT
jgi:broad specificity phosphatase PhoE